MRGPFVRFKLFMNEYIGPLTLYPSPSRKGRGKRNTFSQVFE
jgi:hypothetical protein